MPDNINDTEHKFNSANESNELENVQMPQKNIIMPKDAPAPCKKKNALDNNLLMKFVIIGLLLLIMQVPVLIIHGLSISRESTKENVIREISSKYGSSQILAGPFIKIISPDGKIKTISPKSFSADVTIFPEIRYRNIYQLVVYTATAQLKGNFEPITLKNNDKAYLSVNLEGKRGLVEISGKLGNDTFDGKDSNGMLANIAPENLAKELTFDISLKLRGNQSFQVEPTGVQNEIKIVADWKSPSFIGQFLPTSRDLTPDKFSALWQINQFESSYPRTSYNNYNPVEPVGVDLFIAANVYQQANRVMSYSFIFMGVFLISLLIAEWITKTPSSSLQYFVAACAPVVFYLLLLSISEHIGFMYAYWISAIATAALTASYCAAVFANRLAGISIFAILTLSYVIMYAMLKLENTALLAGSILIFVLLAILMAMTANINRKTN